ncbi:MAG TPA: DNA-formamidopyrimidine glycosylase family protein [Polyangiaceae bacterium]|jgi:formamidopyrimidine-DNA glycosylase|nr:DNA-formamidopyrimidine glycosylase family protein [Polyangiaceae bacterium]
MPELPDVAVYIERLSALFGGQVLENTRLKSPFLVRSFEPPLEAARGRSVTGFRRIGKRIVFELSGDLFLVFHLMIAGRFHLKPKGDKLAGKQSLLGLDFAEHTLVLTEAGSKRRASLFVVQGAASLVEFSRGGLEVLGSSLPAFREALLLENRTLKRALTDPRLFSGIGNAYSDEILHAARLSPVKLTRSLADTEIARLHAQTGAVLELWTERLRNDVGTGFPEKVTAFRPDMAVHGRFQKPCPVCGTPVQRIEYASNELNYCPTCQTGGKLLADRGLSRLLKSDWPKTLEELEEFKAARRE